MALDVTVDGVSFRTREELRKVYDLLRIYFETVSDAVSEKPARPLVVRAPASSVTATSPADDRNDWHRDASRRIGGPATFRELLAEIETTGVTVTGANPRDAIARRVRADSEMMKVGELPRVGKGAAETLWILRDLHDSNQAQDTNHDNGLAFDLEPTPSDSMT